MGDRGWGVAVMQALLEKWPYPTPLCAVFIVCTVCTCEGHLNGRGHGVPHRIRAEFVTLSQLWRAAGPQV